MNSNNTKKSNNKVKAGKKSKTGIKSKDKVKNLGDTNGNGSNEVLTDKQKLFCDEYLIDFNGKQSAIRAGYSTRSAESTASGLLRKNKVKLYIQERSREFLEDRSALAAKTVRHLESVADADITNFILIGTGKRETIIRDLDNIDTRSIASMHVEEKVQRDKKGKATDVFDRTVKIKLWDKPRTLDTLSKVTGLQSSELKLSGSINLNFDLNGFKEKVKILLLGDKKKEDDNQ